MILVDYREGSKDLCGYFARMGVDHEKSDLETGDVVLNGVGPDGPVLIGVEIKSVRDMLNSMQSGRMMSQIKRLAAEFDYYWLLIEGTYRPNPSNGMLEMDWADIYPRSNRKNAGWTGVPVGRRTVAYSSMESYIIGLQARAGVHIAKTANRSETAWWIAHCLGSYFDKEWSKHKSFLEFDRTLEAALFSEPSQVTRTAGSFPNMGKGRAMAASKHFGSVKEMVNATAEDWEQIAGVGRVIAENIVRAIEEVVE